VKKTRSTPKKQTKKVTKAKKTSAVVKLKTRSTKTSKQLATSKLVSALKEETTTTLTENLMPTYTTSLNSNLDWFFRAGALRKQSNGTILNLFTSAFVEDKLLATKILFYMRDVRGGQGERRLFRVVLNHIAEQYPDILIKNIDNIGFYGRWDDLLNLLENNALSLKVKTAIIKYVISQYDNKNVNGLLAKWTPRKGVIFNTLRNNLNLTPKKFRKKLVKLTDVVETKMCKNKWNDINYEHVPSYAMKKYSKAFYKHDEIGFSEYRDQVKSGEKKINAGVLYPHDLVRSIMNGDNKTAELQWENLPDYIGNSGESFIPVCDVSGSMSGLPMEVSISLGIYLSERNKSSFKDAFITFSESPQLQVLRGNLTQRINQLEHADWGMNTNLEKVFKLILDTAKKNKLKQSDMPTKILIISDMEFDSCVQDGSYTAFEMITRMYKEAKYKLPQVVFWNVDSRQSNVPVRMNDQGVALVSGFSPSIMTNLLDGQLDPMKVMLKTVNSERYNRILV
jgi:hypothetical protein